MTSIAPETTEEPTGYFFNVTDSDSKDSKLGLQIIKSGTVKDRAKQLVGAGLFTGGVPTPDNIQEFFENRESARQTTPVNLEHLTPARPKPPRNSRKQPLGLFKFNKDVKPPALVVPENSASDITIITDGSPRKRSTNMLESSSSENTTSSKLSFFSMITRDDVIPPPSPSPLISPLSVRPNVDNPLSNSINPLTFSSSTPSIASTLSLTTTTPSNAASAWVSHVDTKGRTYYYNTATKKSQWTKPLEYNPPSTSRPSLSTTTTTTVSSITPSHKRADSLGGGNKKKKEKELCNNGRN